MSAWDWVAVGVLLLLVFNAAAVVLVSRWGQHMAARNQLIQLDQELDQRARENAA